MTYNTRSLFVRNLSQMFHKKSRHEHGLPLHEQARFDRSLEAREMTMRAKETAKPN